MASFGEICESDEEVFWGPVTAREIEIDWRRVVAEKERIQSACKEEITVTEGLSTDAKKQHEKITSNEIHCGNEDIHDTNPNLNDAESKEGLSNDSLIKASRISEANILSEDADESDLNSSSVNSFISVKGEGHYEVFIPVTPIHQKTNSGLEIGINSCITSGITSNTDFVDVDLNNLSGDKSEAHVKTVQEPNSSFANAESQKSEILTQSMNNVGPEKVALNFDLENIAFIDEENRSLGTDFQVVPINSVSGEIIEEGLAGTGVDNSSKIDSQGELSSYNMKNTTIDNEEAAAIIVEEIKVKVESMDLNSSSTQNEECLNDEQLRPGKSLPVGASKETPVSHDFTISEVTSTSMEERNTGRQTDSSDLSFVSISEEKENNGSEEMETYAPPDKKQKCDEIFKQINNESTSSNMSRKTKIPVLGSTKIPILKPSKLNVLNKDSPWVSEFKMKKVPKPKKPEYVVSPAKLNSLLKFHTANKLTFSQSSGNLYERPTTAPLQTNNRLYNTPQRIVKHASATTLKTPPSQKTIKLKADSASQLKTPPKNLKYRDVASPVAEYIKSSNSTIIRNVLPAKSNGQLPKEASVIKASEEQTDSKSVQLPSLYYSSARRVLISPKTKPSSPTLPKLGERQASVLVTPKPQIFRHTGRVKSEGKNIDKHMPQPIRRSSLHERSFAHLPHQANEDLDVSVLERQ